ncbi:MAG TPA: hypothetical protein VIP11_11555 [Gemmatimonadaceae bacterium]
MIDSIDDPNDQRLKDTYNEVLDLCLDDPAVMGVDIGRRYAATGQLLKGQYVVRVHVGKSLQQWRKDLWGKYDRKKPYAPIAIDQKFPATVEILDASYFSHATATQPARFSSVDRALASPPIEVAHRRRSGGTLGLIVSDSDDVLYMLSCAHVLCGPATDVRTSILHPTFRNGGREPEAVVANFLVAVDANIGDAAIARLTELGLGLVERFKGTPAGSVHDAARAQIGDVVKKSGIGSQTTGIVDGIGRYFLSTPGTAAFDGFVIVPDDEASADISQFGDSGAVWYSAANPANGLGIHVGGAGADVKRRPAIACHLTSVLENLSEKLKKPLSIV